jgi:hypothetical protein
VLGLAAMGAAQVVTPVPLPTGMRVVVGGSGVLVRNAPNYGTCGSPPHECLATDALPPNTFGVVLADAPVLETGGKWYWSRVQFDQGALGWVSAISPYINMLTPPQMVSGAIFSIGASYGPGPILTQAVCILDGVNSPATMQLQNVTCCSDNGPGHAGTLLCPWPKAGLGNHKAVVQAVNSKGTAASEEFQFSVTSAPLSLPPTQPGNMRLTVP